MKELIIVLLLISLFEFSFQSQCTRFEQIRPSDFDLAKIRNIILAKKPPILEDYSNEEVGNEFCYNGMRETDPRSLAQELFGRSGLTFQEHIVKTNDGFLLTVHRIPRTGPPILLSHGLFGSSIDWLLQGVNSLPYMLAAQGYDVWLTNARGNQFSNRHDSLSPNCQEFWDFSYDEIGLYDLPATIDYILSKTGYEKLTYIGHSQGTTAFFVMASLLKEYDAKVSSMIALSPMAWMWKSKSPLLGALAVNEVFGNALGNYQFGPSEAVSNFLSNLLCDSGSFLCTRVPFLVCGFDRRNIDVAMLPDITRQFPAGMSSKVLLHFSQGAYNGQFRRFDYEDLSANLQKYGSLIPPDYPVETISSNVSFFYSNNDWLSNLTDVQELHKSVGNVGDVVFVENYSHFDYLWARDVKIKVYNKVVALVKKYSS